MKDYTLYRETFVKQPPDKVFEFFSKAENLELLTPKWLKFQIVTPLPIAMRQGTVIDYKISLFGIPMNWQSEISAWHPPLSFSDTQLKGPYTKWVHRHRFEEKDGGTLIIDNVKYRMPGAFLTPLINTLFVKPQLNQIFNFRAKIIRQQFSEITG